MVELLSEEGYRPHVLPGDGRIRRIDFKVEGVRLQIRLDEEDPDFVAFGLGYALEEPVADEAVLLRAGHDVQSEAMVAKFFLDPDCTFFEMQAELFLGGHPLNAQQLERCVAVLKRAAAAFQERLRTEVPRARA